MSQWQVPTGTQTTYNPMLHFLLQWICINFTISYIMDYYRKGCCGPIDPPPIRDNLTPQFWIVVIQRLGSFFAFYFCLFINLFLYSSNIFFIFRLPFCSESSKCSST